MAGAAKKNDPEMPRFFAINAGRFVSRGRERHPTRTIDDYELIHVVSGELSMFEAERRFRARAGERLLLIPGLQHGGTANYPRDLSFFWLHILPRNRAAARLLERILRDAQLAPLAAPELYASYWPLLLAEQRVRDTGRVHKQEIMNLLAGVLLAEAGAPPEPPGGLDEIAGSAQRRLIEAAGRYIRLHYAEPIGVSEVARAVGCHPDHLGRAFRTAGAGTVGDRIRFERIAKARSLLEGTNRSVKEIAFAVGYADVAYFRHQFRRECAASPGEYRRWRTAGYLNTQ